MMWNKIKSFFKSKDNMFNSDGYIGSDNVVKLVPPTPPKDTRRKDAHYTVGTNDFGDTVFKMHSDGGIVITLTMNSSATRQMIRMLEATLIDEEDDDGQHG